MIKMAWFNIIKNFSDKEIFAALGLDEASHHELDYYYSSWTETHKKVTLRALNFMKGLPNVEWKSSRRGDYTPEEISHGGTDLDIYGEVTVGNVMITTPKVNISNIGRDVSKLGTCEATTVWKNDSKVIICVNPDYASKNPWGDFLASSVMFYYAILTQDIPLNQTTSPELVWLAGVAKDNTQLTPQDIFTHPHISENAKDKWELLKDAMRHRPGITDANWRSVRKNLNTALKNKEGSPEGRIY